MLPSLNLPLMYIITCQSYTTGNSSSTKYFTYLNCCIIVSKYFKSFALLSRAAPLSYLIRAYYIITAYVFRSAFAETILLSASTSWFKSCSSFLCSLDCLLLTSTFVALACCLRMSVVSSRLPPVQYTYNKQLNFFAKVWHSLIKRLQIATTNKYPTFVFIRILRLRRFLFHDQWNFVELFFVVERSHLVVTIYCKRDSFAWYADGPNTSSYSILSSTMRI